MAFSGGPQGPGSHNTVWPVNLNVPVLHHMSEYPHLPDHSRHLHRYTLIPSFAHPGALEPYCAYIGSVRNIFSHKNKREPGLGISTCTHSVGS